MSISQYPLLFANWTQNVKDTYNITKYAECQKPKQIRRNGNILQFEIINKLLFMFFIIKLLSSEPIIKM